MSLKNTPELHAFLSSYFSEADADADAETVAKFTAATNTVQQRKVVAQANGLIESGDLSVEDFGIETNRWFGDSEEAAAWLASLVEMIENGSAAESGAGSDAPTKDVNGTVLVEGDNVQVIKDLKVRGGTSDLKRGTLVKKIHLIGDPDNIECRVDGSTLVLKTCFLKKV